MRENKCGRGTWLEIAAFLATMACIHAETHVIIETAVFTNGADGYPVFRIPAVVRANDGTLLAICEERAGTADGGNIDIFLKRSNDNGKSWGPLVLVQEEGGDAAVTIGNPAPVVDSATGQIHLPFCRDNSPMDKETEQAGHR